MGKKPTLYLFIVALIFAIIGLFALRSHTKSKGDVFSPPSMLESLSLNKQAYRNANAKDSEKRQETESRQVVGERSRGFYLFFFTLFFLSMVSLIVYIFWEELSGIIHIEQKRKNRQTPHKSEPADFKFVSKSWFNQSEEPIQEESSHSLIELASPSRSKIKAAIVPHAGLMYSGSVVANTFEQVDWTQYDTFLLLSTCHYARGNYQLPYTRKKLGIPYRKGSIDILHIPELNFLQIKEIMEGEHSWQVLLWFIDEINDYLKRNGQKTLKIIPLLIGKELSHQELAIIEKYLRENPRTFLCANTDLLHRPGTNRKEVSTLQKFDKTTIQQIKEAVTHGKALDRMRTEEDTMCGFFAVQALTQIANNLKLIPVNGHYANSFQASQKDSGQYVGYLGIAFKEIPSKDIPANVLANNKGVLGKRIGYKEIDEIAMRYKQPNDQRIHGHGIFVTIEKGEGKHLRGCRGNYKASEHGLRYWVARQTLDSALNDYRFSPVKEKELAALSFEISILEPPILIYKRDRGNSPTPFEAFKQKYNNQNYGITITFKDGGAAFYLPSVLQRERGTLEQRFNNVVTGLRRKSDPDRPQGKDYTLEIATMELHPTKVI